MKSQTPSKVLLRRINPQFHNDLKSLKKIDRDPMVNHWMHGGSSNKKELIEFATNSRENKIWAVSLIDKEYQDNPPMLGWVRFYLDEERRLKRTVAGRKFLKQKKQIWETSFAKFHSAPKHIMSTGVKKACMKMLGGSKKNIALSAYVSRHNSNSVYLLEKCGFSRAGQVRYGSRSKKADYLYICKNMSKIYA